MSRLLRTESRTRTEDRPFTGSSADTEWLRDVPGFEASRIGAVAGLQTPTIKNDERHRRTRFAASRPTQQQQPPPNHHQNRDHYHNPLAGVT